MERLLSKLVKNIIPKIKLFFSYKYFGFIDGHGYLDSNQKLKLKKLIFNEDEKIISNFESQFSNLVGEGLSSSFASGRMAFYVLMQVLGVGKGDEVIINGATCSVMVNAILRIKAMPIYSDIDPNTLGSSLDEIKKCITSRTKIVVAQHSFGIPCDIHKIKELCASKNIFLLEDSALALGSSINNQPVGSFGDAALFSTDHTKPINTFSGGLLYTSNLDLQQKIKSIRDNSKCLPTSKKMSIFNRILIEGKWTHSRKFGLFQIIDVFKIILTKISKKVTPYLDKDSGIDVSQNNDYPYPAKLPSFLAELGLIELQRWERVSNERVKNLSAYIDYFERNNLSQDLPLAYFDPSRKIIPLRIAWSQEDGLAMRKKMKYFIQVSWIWFTEPIISTTDPLCKMMYNKGDCPISEKIGVNIINLPTSIPCSEVGYILKKFDYERI